MATTRTKTWAAPTKQEIASAIASSGYPFEIACAMEADRAGFQVIPNWTWFDKRTGDVREVDLVGEFLAGAANTLVNLHVLMECKTYRAGLVLFEWETAQRTAYEWAHFDIAENHFWGQPASVRYQRDVAGDVVAGHSFSDWSGWGTRRWEPSGSPCIQLGKIEKDKNGNLKVDQPDVHKALDGLTHALFTYRREAGQYPAGISTPVVNLAVPILVVDGPIYVHRTSGTERRAGLRRVKQATVVRRFMEEGAHRVVRVDVVQGSALRGYLARITADVYQLALHVQKHSALLVESIKLFGAHPPRA